MRLKIIFVAVKVRAIIFLVVADKISLSLCKNLIYLTDWNCIKMKRGERGEIIFKSRR